MKQLLALLVLSLPLFASHAQELEPTGHISNVVIGATRPVKFDFPGVQVASVIDPTSATGSTLFYFPNFGNAAYDARGGSVASIETSLLEDGGYSNEIDGIVFSGGSTMGLAATDGVRRRIFKMRSQKAKDFDFIPSIPGAVIYDYGGRTDPRMDKLCYPTAELGEKLMDNLSSHTFYIGRTGAGINATSSKVSQAIWGGQGFRYEEFEGGLKIITAVVVNSMGDVVMPNGVPLSRLIPVGVRDDYEKLKLLTPKPKQNTTLSIVITNLPMDRSQLKRLAVTVHTSMGASIRPFQTYTDGDILFAVSVPDKTLNKDDFSETAIAIAASEMMAAAIVESGKVANRIK